MARTALSKILTYKDGSGEDIKIRMTDVLNLENDLKCFSNKVSMDILISLSNGMKEKNEFNTYFPRVKKATFYNSLNMLRGRNLVKIERVEGVMYYMLNIRELNRLQRKIEGNNTEKIEL